MKLALTAVYLGEEPNDDGLLRVHLDQIERNTPEPYTLYAAVNRLPADSRAMLAGRRNVRVLELPVTGLRSSRENAFYLELLVKAAIEEGATHVCTLHLDSFPVRPLWATELERKLRGDCVLAGLQRDPFRDRKPMTAFMLFTRDFYLSCRPAFLLSEEALKSTDYRRYATRHPHIKDSGSGYGFTVFREGLSWHPLVRTDKGPAGWGFGIFGGLAFHLGGANWYPSATARKPARSPRLARWVERSWRVASPLLPARLRLRLARLAPFDVRVAAGSWRVAQRKAALVASPEAFLRDLGV